MRISVVLCTYNGERYLPAQLASIAAQTRLPDELVVCDDVSTDETARVVQDFAAQAPFPVRFSINARNLGSTSNFAQAIEFSNFELIVLTDQDDVWRPNKLAQLAALLADDAIGMAFSNADIVDDTLTPLGYSLWDGLDDGNRVLETVVNNRLFERLLRGNIVTGATMAFRSQFKELVLPIPANWMHDEWIALLISAVAPYRATSERLISYRQHAGQQLGVQKFSLAALLNQFTRRAVPGAGRPLNFEAMAGKIEAAIKRLETVPKLTDAERRIADLHDKSMHFRSRSRLRASLTERLPLIARELRAGRYHRYSLGWLAAVRDLIAV